MSSLEDLLLSSYVVHILFVSNLLKKINGAKTMD